MVYVAIWPTFEPLLICPPPPPRVQYPLEGKAYVV